MSKHYVNNKKLYEVLKDYKERVEFAKANGKPKPPLPNYVAESIMLIAERLARKPGFSRYSYVEEMIGDGVLACVKYIDSFNPEKSQNPFSYITQIIHHAFINRLNLEQKQHYVKALIAKNSGELRDDENFSADSLNNVIESFEDKMERRREKAAARNQDKGVSETEVSVEEAADAVDRISNGAKY